ncbi:MAG: CPBP family intramembrane metalloprotease [Phycisphaerae bacterium]|nr:CPBP family intramembrane metalloprotease [Phycisphaerae bacterium]
MDKLATSNQNILERATARKTCPYCGALLNPRYYFCLSCATPYKQVELVLPRKQLLQLTEGQLIVKNAPHVWPMFWTYMIVVVGMAFVCYGFFQGSRLDLSLILQGIAFFVTTCIFASRHWDSLVVQFKCFGFFRLSAILGLLALVPLLAINYYYHSWLTQLLGVERAFPLDEFKELGQDKSAMIVLFCVLPAIMEEIAFRGLIQHWLQVAIRPFYAIVLASVLFTAMHFSIVSAPYLFAVGMLLGWTKYKTGSLYPSMLIHFIHNFIVVVFFWM